MRFSLFITWLCIGFGGGIAFLLLRGDMMPSWQALFAGSVFMLCALLFRRAHKSTRFWQSAGLLAGVLLGFWYGGMRTSAFFSPSDIVRYADSSFMRVEGEALSAQKGAKGDLRVVLEAKALQKGGPAQKKIATSGKVLAIFSEDKKISSGDYLVLGGRLEEPKSFDSFDYPGYLAGKGIFVILRDAKIYSLKQSSGFNVFAKIENIHSDVQILASRFLHGPSGEIIREMAIGEKKALSDTTGAVLSRSGIRHITSISGMHVMLLMELLMGALLFLSIKRRLAISCALFFLALFLVFIGFPSAALRAGIMGGVLYGAQLFGRPLNNLRLLLYTAAVMLAWDPRLLVGDIGFQLSFAAMFGIFTLTPFFETAMARAPMFGAGENQKSDSFGGHIVFGGEIARIVSMSLAATIFTAPLAAFHFGTVSLAGIIMNLVAVPLLPFMLVLAFFMLAGGAINFALGAVFSWLLWGIVFPLFAIASFTASLPFAVVAVPPYSAIVLIFGYSLIGAFFLLLARRGYNPILASASFMR